jgi:eukaryotic-like serine/threonine-protein kinase
MPVLAEGQDIRGTRFTVERLIGEGAFAEVYRVRHCYLGRQAMKVFKTPGATEQEIKDDIAEAVILSTLKHRNIVEVLDADVLETARGRFGYFTMTLMLGGSLQRYWASFGRQLMPVYLAVEVVRQSSEGLNIAHRLSPPIIHRDIKPQNVLVGFDGDGLHIRLSDFGLAKAVNPLTLLTTAGGTLGFKPPESLDNIDSCAADVWAMGTMLYLLLTDEMPFPSLNSRNIGAATRFLRPLRSPRTLNINVDPHLESIVVRCLAPEPSDRYRDAGALLADLKEWKPADRLPKESGAAKSRSEGFKTALGTRSVRDLAEEAKLALREAMALANDPIRLMIAADLLEEAISKDPSLSERYRPLLKLWRRGIMHVPAERSRK